MPIPDFEQPLVPAPPLVAAMKPATNAFIGPLGLRAGWGIALFLILAIAFAFGIGYSAVRASGMGPELKAQQVRARENAREVKAHHVVPAPQPMHLYSQSIGEVSQVAGPLLAALALAYIERRRFRVYGLALRHLRDMLPGAVWGLVAMSLLVALLRGLHLLVFDGQLLHGAAIFRWGVAWLALFLLVGIGEEFLFRGYVQFTLMRGLLGLGRRISPTHPRLAAFWLSAVIWSLVFSAGHLSNAGENPVGLVSVFTAGVLFSYALWRTGSLWWGIGYHMTWDWAQSFLFGTPDS